MGLVTAGGNTLAQFIIGAGNSTAGNANCYYNTANAALGVGDSSNGLSAGQTDLQAATNKTRVVVNTAPTASGLVLTFVTQFTGAVGNYVWAEIGLFNSPTAATGTMMSRLVSAMGTKVSPAIWTVTYTLTLAVS